jgi:hypothetical protein
MKIYGLCLKRLNYQINVAKSRNGKEHHQEKIILESYNTGELDEVIDILELYDIEERTPEGIKEKLNDLAYTISVISHETLTFDFDRNGHLGLYLLLNGKSEGLVK